MNHTPSDKTGLQNAYISRQLVSTIRRATSNCSVKSNPLSPLSKMGFLESDWNGIVSRTFLDRSLSSFENTFDSSMIISNTYRGYRRRRAIRSLMRDIAKCRYLSRRSKSESSKLVHVSNFLSLAFANRYLCSSERLMNVQIYRHLGLSILNCLDNPNFTSEKNLIEMSDCNETLIKQVLVSLLRQLVDCKSDLDITQLRNLGYYDFVQQCYTSNSVRSFVFTLLSTLVEKSVMNDTIMYRMLKLLFLSGYKLFPGDLNVAKVQLQTNTFFNNKSSISAILLSLNPFDLSKESFSWACRICQHPTKWTHPKTFMMMTLEWFHASLIRLLVEQSEDSEDQKLIISFLTQTYLFGHEESLPEDTILTRKAAFEVTSIQAIKSNLTLHLFQNSFVTLITQLRQLINSKDQSIPINRVLAPFRQFASRCNLVVKISSGNSLPTIGKVLLSFFIILCPSCRSIGQSVLDTLLSDGFPEPKDRFNILLESASVIMSAADHSSFLQTVKCKQNVKC